jgi:hypothetical protein
MPDLEELELFLKSTHQLIPNLGGGVKNTSILF